MFFISCLFTLISQSQAEHLVEVRVWDSGSPPLSATTRVKVRVVEESRYPPLVFPFSASVVAYQQAFPGGIIGRVTALDQDPYDTLTYSVRRASPAGGGDVSYFDVDADDGTVVALTPLDAGVYEVGVVVSDGKFEKHVAGEVSVMLISQEMLLSSVVVRVGPVAPAEFLSQYRTPFVEAMRSVLGTELRGVTILSIQPARAYAHRTRRDEEAYAHRTRRDLEAYLDVLLAVELKENEYINRNVLYKILKSKESSLRTLLNLPLVATLDSVCGPEVECLHGACEDVIEMSVGAGSATPFQTRASSLVAPPFVVTAACVCEPGYGGAQCQDLVPDACGRRPCSEFEVCAPADNQRGYICECPRGFGGPKCQVDLVKCQEPTKCHFSTQPLSFSGNGYAQYQVPRQEESGALAFSAYVRTRRPAGTLLYAAGDVDHSLLEVADGLLQYRWDCGSGEGLVRLQGTRLDDDQWHLVNLTRDGSSVTIAVDGTKASGASPGESTIMSVDSIFLGASMVESGDDADGVLTTQEFLGCLDEVTLDGARLPLASVASSDLPLVSQDLPVASSGIPVASAASSGLPMASPDLPVASVAFSGLLVSSPGLPLVSPDLPVASMASSDACPIGMFKASITLEPCISILCTESGI